MKSSKTEKTEVMLIYSLQFTFQKVSVFYSTMREGYTSRHTGDPVKLTLISGQISKISSTNALDDETTQ